MSKVPFTDESCLFNYDCYVYHRRIAKLMAQGEYDEGADAGVRYTAEELEDIWAKQSNHVELASRITRQSCSFSFVEILYISTNINGICL